MKLATVPSNVVVLTLDNFDQVVLDEIKDVLMEFYASWLVYLHDCLSLAMFILLDFLLIGTYLMIGFSTGVATAKTLLL